jgi:hypothetical protein
MKSRCCECFTELEVVVVVQLCSMQIPAGHISNICPSCCGIHT